MRKITVMLASVAAAGIAVGAPVAAQAEPVGTVGASLTLTKTYEHGTAISQTLTCDPEGGTHPNAVQACAELAKVEADFDRLSAKDGADKCKEQNGEFHPVRVEAQGIWRGNAVSYRHSFLNSCWLSANTGTVFQF
ncbi:SSI family serine proteinase inhibitor [Amycolatopsis sp. SID8362]|uniref:SSI family serine proteinase inhibitor n=1 Tax=Amycolatopsis sp. SID8362 TaxID=2690346 RepID=UPI00136E7304|nr:SSI family serine proteinase inhibitor [Amycolatopsis sp. SID8362]NBH03504.1 hypothetical protein [Amycolatopsis sp. SID8362]NED40204.1 hypothetical protein [Amycolatopsis sp. SID8362]